MIAFFFSKIDQLIDATLGHQLLSFMNNILGDNQIHMVFEDEEKIVFVIWGQWNALFI